MCGAALCWTTLTPPLPARPPCPAPRCPALAHPPPAALPLPLPLPLPAHLQLDKGDEATRDFKGIYQECAQVLYQEIGAWSGTRLSRKAEREARAGVRRPVGARAGAGMPQPAGRVDDQPSRAPPSIPPPSRPPRRLH